MTPMNMEICRYDSSMADEWNDFVARSKNGNFLLDRRYMDYHSDRFDDFSMVITDRGRIRSLLPANRSGDTLYSHQGLTYGGLIMSDDTRSSEVLTAFDLINDLCRRAGISTVVYRPAPYIYARVPAEEDLYALFARCGAALTARSVSTTINRAHPLRFSTLRRRSVNKAVREGIEVVESDDFAPFWHILNANLNERFGVKAVHSLDEIHLLHNRFPQNIRLFTAMLDGECLAGTVMYLAPTVAHTQYIAASPEGKKRGALDIVMDRLINDVYVDRPYFDFGISTEDGGRSLNSGLIAQKEGFGGRAVCYDTYTYYL